MAVNQSRSMLSELDEGRTDGSQRKVVRNRAGSVDRATRQVRATLHAEAGYGYLSEDPVEQLHGDESIPR